MLCEISCVDLKCKKAAAWPELGTSGSSLSSSLLPWKFPPALPKQQGMGEKRGCESEPEPRLGLAGQQVVLGGLGLCRSSVGEQSGGRKS